MINDPWAYSHTRVWVGMQTRLHDPQFAGLTWTAPNDHVEAMTREDVEWLDFHWKLAERRDGVVRAIFPTPATSEDQAS